MINKTKGRDYFSFESINDHEGNLVCYHVTMIGTIEADGLPRIRSDMGQDGTKKMTFGKITLRGCDRKIGILLRETDSKVAFYSHTEEENIDMISFAAKGWRADEAFELEEGDRVLIEGRAYIRETPSRSDDNSTRRELSVTVTGIFRLGRKRRPESMHSRMKPQHKHSERLEDDDTPIALRRMETQHDDEMMSYDPVNETDLLPEDKEPEPVVFTGFSSQESEDTMLPDDFVSDEF